MGSCLHYLFTTFPQASAFASKLLQDFPFLLALLNKLLLGCGYGQIREDPDITKKHLELQTLLLKEVEGNLSKWCISLKKACRC